MMHRIVAVLDTLLITANDKAQWLEDLSRPTEAMFCSIILASLPRLQSVEIYVKASHPSEQTTSLGQILSTSLD